MWHFELTHDTIYAINSILQGTAFSESERWGIKIGGRWTLDYTWKLVFGISDEDWYGRCDNIKTRKDFYDFCDWLGVRYRNDNGKIYHKGIEVK